MPYKNVTFPVHRYEGTTATSEIDAEVFGNGFVHIKNSRQEVGKPYEFRTILIDPDDIENLEVALKEAKLRRNASARRRRRKLAREAA